MGGKVHFVHMWHLFNTLLNCVSKKLLHLDKSSTWSRIIISMWGCNGYIFMANDSMLHLVCPKSYSEHAISMQRCYKHNLSVSIKWLWQYPTGFFSIGFCNKRALLWKSCEPALTLLIPDINEAYWLQTREDQVWELIPGRRMVQWLALLPHSKKIPGSNLAEAFLAFCVESTCFFPHPYFRMKPGKWMDMDG